MNASQATIIRDKTELKVGMTKEREIHIRELDRLYEPCKREYNKICANFTERDLRKLIFHLLD